LIASNFVVNVGWGLCWPYLNFRLYDIGAVYLQLSLMDSLAAITYLASRLWGALSDYYGRRKPFMLVGFAGSAVPVAFMALYNRSVWALLALYLVSSFSWGIAFPSLVAALTSDPEREKATTVFALVGSLGWALGASLMGPAEGALGPPGFFLLCSLMLALFPAILAFYEEEALPRKEGPLRSYIRGSLSLRFRARRGFGFLLAGVFLSWFGLQWSGPPMRMKIYDVLGRSKMQVGLLMGLSSVASAVALALGRKAVEKLGGLRTLLASVASYAVIIPAFGLTWSPVLLVALWLAPVWPFFNLGYMLSPAELSSEETRAEAVGCCEVVKNVGVLLGLFGGLAADVMGREEALLLSALPLGLALIPIAASYRSSRATEGP